MNSPTAPRTGCSLLKIVIPQIYRAQRNNSQPRPRRQSSPWLFVSIGTGTSSLHTSNRALLLSALICASLLGAFLYLDLTVDQPNLNTTSFSPYTIKSITHIPGSTAFFLTLQVPHTASLADAWRHGLWSVEIKQPQLQIARHYTPMAPTTCAEDNQKQLQELQFFIRQYDGGEVSTYLSRLRPGDTVELRGPHLGFDLGKRLGRHGGKVVCLAGGTGIAPALQAARWLLLLLRERRGEPAVEIEIWWANRTAEECSGCARVVSGSSSSGRWWHLPSSSSRSTGTKEADEPSVVVEQIRELQAAYERQGHRLHLQCAVDGVGGSRISTQHIREAVRGLFRSGAACSPSAASSSSSSSGPCYYHTQTLLQDCTEHADDVLARQQRPCSCPPGRSGKNLFLISGPEGLVSAFVGPKNWAAGAERQGPLGGVVGDLVKKEPDLWKDWLVLKL